MTAHQPMDSFGVPEGLPATERWVNSLASSAASAEPTAEQIETAWQAVRPDYTEIERGWTSIAQRVQVDRVARALAAAVTAEREKYLRVADDLPEALLRAAHHDGVIRPHSFDHNGVSEIVGRYDAIAALAARRIREVTT